MKPYLDHKYTNKAYKCYINLLEVDYSLDIFIGFNFILKLV